MHRANWHNLTPTVRCDWIDQLRGWAVIAMIEVHAVNVWLRPGMLPDWLNFAHGLVAPSFIMCAGCSLALSTFRPDGSLSAFAPVAKRLAAILCWAYALHAPGLTLADWTVFATPQKFRELAQIDVLQCIVFSLLILQGLARTIRRPLAYAAVAMVMAVATAMAAPRLWQPGVAAGWWLPIRGLVNGNPEQGVASLFPLFPWFAFAAGGSVLGILYRHFRVLSNNGKARWSESRWLVALACIGGVLYLWGMLNVQGAMGTGSLLASDAGRLYNTTLPSVAERLGLVCMAGALLGWLAMLRGQWLGPNWVQAASRQSLLLYMLHLTLIFTVLLSDTVRTRTGWEEHSLGWHGTLALTVFLIVLNLAAAVAWQRIRSKLELARMIQKTALLALVVWFFTGGWGRRGHHPAATAPPGPDSQIHSPAKI